MKKTILALLIFVASFAQAQIVKKDTSKGKPAKPVYEYFYKVSPEIFNLLVGSTHGYMDGLKYDQKLSSDEQRRASINVDLNLNNVLKTSKLDSAIIVKKDTTTKVVPKKKKE